LLLLLFEERKKEEECKKQNKRFSFLPFWTLCVSFFFRRKLCFFFPVIYQTLKGASSGFWSFQGFSVLSKKDPKGSKYADQDLYKELEGFYSDQFQPF
jgi:hypothetical protein